MHVVRFALELMELAFFTPNNVSVSESDESDACAVAGLNSYPMHLMYATAELRFVITRLIIISH